MNHEARGIHAIADVSEAPDLYLLNDPDRLGVIMAVELTRIGAELVRDFKHSFKPQGCSVLFVLGESHASIHTYPEHGVYFVDVFTCGDLNAMAAIEAITAKIGGKPWFCDIARGGPRPQPPDL